jgi:Tol biopolymer transport system component
VVDWILADYDAYLVNPEGGLNGSLLPASDSWEYCSWSWDHLRFICPDAFAQQPTTFNVFETDGTTAATKQVAEIDFSKFSSLLWVGYPRYSPDGTKIAFLGSGANGFDFYTGIMVIDSSGTKAPTLIATDPQFIDITQSMPHYTPDGNAIIFAMSSGLWIVNANGTNLRQLAPPPAVQGMFSRDSSALYYSANGCIYRANTDGTNPTCVFQGSSDLELMDISPSGRQLVFAEPPGGDIYVANTDGANLQQTNGLQSASW